MAEWVIYEQGSTYRSGSVPFGAVAGRYSTSALVLFVKIDMTSNERFAVKSVPRK